jgi:opacity protein-like surface antigen
MIGRYTACCGVLLSLTGMVSARTTAPWDGGYLGFDFGDALTRTCNSWALDDVTISSANASQFINQSCSKSSALIGGLDIGENFQYKRLVWGLGADLDYWGGKTTDDPFKYFGAAPPPGTYTFSRKESPRGFAIIGPRIGYAGDSWLPYLRVGAVLSVGARNSELFYAPSGAIKPTASFTGGKDFSTTGWVTGGGIELGLNGAWSISAEYLHASLGKGSDSLGGCNGPATACAMFSGVSLSNSHGGYSANIVRVGITYWFDYWEL